MALSSDSTRDYFVILYIDCGARYKDQSEVSNDLLGLKVCYLRFTDSLNIGSGIVSLILSRMIAIDGNQPVIFSHRTIDVVDILPHLAQSTSIAFDSCTAEHWKKVGEALASLSQLHTLSLENCNTGVPFWKELSLSKSILRLRASKQRRNTEQC